MQQQLTIDSLGDLDNGEQLDRIENALIERLCDTTTDAERIEVLVELRNVQYVRELHVEDERCLR